MNDRPFEPPTEPAVEPTGAHVAEPVFGSPWAGPVSEPAAETNVVEPARAVPDPSTYSPAPDRTDRDRAAWQTPVQPTPEAWFEAISVPTLSEAAGAPASRRPTGGILGPVLVAALLAATLASGGTYAALRVSGALDAPHTAGASAPSPASPAGQTASAPVPVKIDESSAIIDVAAKVSPAVVRIVSSSVANPNDPTAIPTEGIGSGIIFDKNGWIVTNRHVVSGSSSLLIQLTDGREFNGTIYGIDTLTDLAIVKVDATGLPTAPIGDSSTLKVGQTTIDIGYPLNSDTRIVASGILSGMGERINVSAGPINNLLQTDTAINPGNSGGPLLDIGGNVIGIVTAVATGANNIGYAIPINIARPIMEQALAGQKLARPYIGIRYQMLTAKLATELKVSVHEGAYVDGGQSVNAQGQSQSQPAVVAGGPADKAGIKQGDIITTIEGQAIDTDHPLDSVLTQFAPGRTITIGLLRNGSQMTVQVTLGVRPADL
jgi:S1-C subfamily serine protease